MASFLDDENILCFGRLAYSTDGSCLFGVGDSHYVCAYDTKHGVLLRKIALTQNRSLDGILHKLNSKNILEDGTGLSKIVCFRVHLHEKLVIVVFSSCFSFMSFSSFIYLFIS